MRVLIVNAGSSSLKLRVLDGDDVVLADRQLDAPEGWFDPDELAAFVDEAPDVHAVGHRVVHGGAQFREATRITDEVLDRLDALSDLAPLHNPHAVRAARALAGSHPELPAVACFDTAFHATIPEAAAVYAVPWEWTVDWGIRRFGFHGLNHRYVAYRAAELLGRPAGELRTVTCHLGAGASLAAVDGGRSVDTTMGFTPLEGLVMANRSGDVDPGALLWAQQHRGLTAGEADEALNHRSGLLGVSGVSADLREVEAAADRGDERARLAIDVFVHRLRAGIAGMVAAMGGIDALVFTGGIGEHSARMRHRACAGLGFLGVALDEVRNEDPDAPDADLTARDEADGSVPFVPASPVPVAASPASSGSVPPGPGGAVSGPGDGASVLVVTAREDLEIARQTRATLP